VFPETQRFCRVSYIDFTAGARKHRGARNVTPAEAIPLLHKDASKSGVPTNKNLRRMFDARQIIKIGM
jgi:hypothetical protein